jgi:CheY-like chemotaxis protein
MNLHIPILIADDDEDDRYLLKSAFEDCQFENPLFYAENGVEVMDYLLRRNKYQNEEEYPLPGLIFLDLNMPKKDGREALKEIKQHPELRSIPVIVMTTSKAELDIHISYQNGANCYVTKPVSFEQLVSVVQIMGRFWLNTATIPVPKM